MNNGNHRQFLWEHAIPIADQIMMQLAPFCERITIAGSVRRRKRSVKDIEILAVPKTFETVDMFNEVHEVHSQLDDFLTELVKQNGQFFKKRPNKRGHYTFGPKNKLMIHVPSGIPIDVFTTTAENWGMSLVVRTGPKEFNIAMMSRFQELSMRGHAYGGVSVKRPNDELGDYWEVLDCPDEESVFKLLGWEYAEPHEREKVGRR